MDPKFVFSLAVSPADFTLHGLAVVTFRQRKCSLTAAMERANYIFVKAKQTVFLL